MNDLNELVLSRELNDFVEVTRDQLCQLGGGEMWRGQWTRVTAFGRRGGPGYGLPDINPYWQPELIPGPWDDHETPGG